MKKLLFLIFTAASLHGEAQLTRIGFADTPPGPYMILFPTGLTLTNNFAGTQGTSSSYTMTWFQWTASADTVVAPTGVLVSADNVTFASSIIITTSGSHGSQAIYAAMAGANSPGAYSGNITHTAGAVVVYEGVSGTTNGVPSLSATPSSLTLTDTVTTPGAPKTLAVTAAYLSGSWNMTAPTAPTPIEFSGDGGTTWASSLSSNSTSQNVLVRVTSAAASGPIVDTVAISSAGVSTVKIPVGGTVSNPGSAHYRPITIPTSSVTGTLSNFPVLFNETQTFLKTTANGGEVQNANAYDVTFSTDAAGTSLLNWEVESYNASTGQLVAWIKLPSLTTSASTTIYMRYNQAGISTFQGGSAGSVWDANFDGVWHMNQTLTAAGQTLTDYTSNAHVATSFGTWASGQTVAGPVGSAINNLKANGDYFQVSSSGGTWASKAGDFTAEGWFNVSTLDQTTMTFGASAYGNDMNFFGAHYRLYNGSDDIVDATATPASTWVHLVITRASGTLTVYHNGVSTISGAGATFTYNLDNFFISNGQGSSSNIQADEMRISSIARSAAWIAAEYLNMNAPDTFYSLGTEH